jgi:hypothetical protein
MHRRAFIAGLALAPAAQAEAGVPQSSTLNLVTAHPQRWDGHDCLAVDLTDAEQRLRLETTGGGNRPSFAIVHPDFTDGVLEVAIAGVLSGKGHPTTAASSACPFTSRPTSRATRPSTCA